MQNNIIVDPRKLPGTVLLVPKVLVVFEGISLNTNVFRLLYKVSTILTGKMLTQVLFTQQD